MNQTNTQEVNVNKKKRFQRGSSFLAILIVLAGVAMAGSSYVGSTTATLRNAKRNAANVQTTNLCEAGVQSVLRQFWREFRVSQNFISLDTICTGATISNSRGTVTGSISGVGRFSAGVISYVQPEGNSFTRVVIIRSVGWVDANNNGSIDDNEPVKVVDVTAAYQLSRSQVFDYSYFVNNYGWMSGFSSTSLVVNGDMRANGDFTFSGGSPTVNGSVIATANDKLSPASAGDITGVPVKQDNASYISTQNGTSNPDDLEKRMRPGYDATIHGARGSATYEQWRDIIFDSDANITNGTLSGAALADRSGTRGWTNPSGTVATNLLDNQPTDEVIMPDLSDLATYQNLSNNYTDTKATFKDGTANPYSGQGAWLDVWNSSTNSYQRVTTNGVLSGSVVLIGTDSKPIKVHGPVTITQDVLIKGTVQGQGTIYTGRNIHIVGSIRYKVKPSFRGNSPTDIDNQNEKADMLGLAARGSVIMGKTTDFTNAYPLQYMTPPFTKGRWDLNGNWIPPYNATDTDASGFQKYKTVLGDTVMNSVAESVNQIDAILYTNFVGGGNIGSGGGGVLFNGSIISKDEAMVVYSLPMKMNYDSRVKERALTSTPLIDIKLPRSPVLLRSSWQDRGFSYAQ